MVFAPLFLGCWIYWTGRKTLTRYESVFFQQKNAKGSTVADWLPDYFWCLSLVSCLVWIWDGWEKVPARWLWSIWVLSGLSELMQYLHWIPGSGDWMDVLCYQLAFLTIYIFNKTKML